MTFHFIKKIGTTTHILNNTPPAISGLMGLVVFILCFILARTQIAFMGDSGFLLACLCTAITIAFIDVVFFRVYLQPDVGKFTTPKWPDTMAMRSLLLKFIAIGVSIALALLYFELNPMYKLSVFNKAFGAITPFIPWVSAFMFCYIIGAHLILEKKEDTLSNFGLFIVSLGRNGNKKEVRDYALTLLIKLFFLPLMLAFGLRDWDKLTNLYDIFSSYDNFAKFVYYFLYLIDLSFVVFGYVCAFRLLNAHVRWPERTFLGWFFCLMCYVPFWQFFYRFFAYQDDIFWSSMFDKYSIAYMMWQYTLLVLLITYTWSTVSFGLRFSNLTYRGLVSSGPYSIMRHPAYISKNLSWWMIHVPFISTSTTLAITNSLGLLGVNAIYFARAKYEERCCGLHDDYKEYSKNMAAKNGIIARVLRIVNKAKPTT